MPTPKLRICAADLANLRASGLTDETVRANGLWTENAALVFPYRDLRGRDNCFARTRPHKPRIIDGKPAKYEQPPGTPPRAYFPATALTQLREGDGPIYITEGEKKSLALAQAGYACIGLGGVWCWKVKGTDELIDDLREIQWGGRAFYLVFDFDEKPATRRQVQAAARRLARALRTAGAHEVYSVDLPPVADGGKQGADDFLVAHGADAFRKLVEAAMPILDVPPITHPCKGLRLCSSGE